MTNTLPPAALVQAYTLSLTYNRWLTLEMKLIHHLEHTHSGHPHLHSSPTIIVTSMPAGHSSCCVEFINANRQKHMHVHTHPCIHVTLCTSAVYKTKERIFFLSIYWSSWHCTYIVVAFSLSYISKLKQSVNFRILKGFVTDIQSTITKIITLDIKIYKSIKGKLRGVFYFPKTELFFCLIYLNFLTN